MTQRTTCHKCKGRGIEFDPAIWQFIRCPVCGGTGKANPASQKPKEEKPQ